MTKRWLGRSLAALFLVACSSSSGPQASQDAGTPGWHTVLQGLKATLLCVWGTTPNDAFAVGGPLGNGTPATILHYDGSAWKDLAPGGTETFWWAHGTSDHDVWAVGTNGHIVHWDGAKFSDHSMATTATLYGVWAAAPDDVWVVGGTPEGGTKMPNDLMLHWDGTSFTPMPLPKVLGRAFFKVWGTSSSNLYVVGEFGTIWHRVGTTWTLESSPAMGNLTTVFGCSATQVYAVGFNDVLRSDGKTWTRENVTVVNGPVNGVSCDMGGAVIVGGGGFKQRLVSGAGRDAGRAQWVDDTTLPPSNDFHGAWADPSGGYWAAGGDFISTAMPGVSRAGVLAYYGVTAPSSAMSP